jgi:PAS domain S-box-containing protein
MKPTKAGNNAVVKKRKRVVHMDRLNLTNPQKDAVSVLIKSQRNKFKKLLHETHEKLHVISQNYYSLEFWLGLNGTFEHISPSCEHITGYAREEFMQRKVTLADLIYSDDMERFQVDRQLAADGIGNTDVEYRWVHKDGSLHWAVATWCPVYTRRERHVGTRVSLIDTTVEKRLYQQADGMHEIMERLMAGGDSSFIFALASDGKIASWPNRAASVTGLADGEVIGIEPPVAFDGAWRGNVEKAISSINMGSVSHQFESVIKASSGAGLTGVVYICRSVAKSGTGGYYAAFVA